jgi:hypothetical protein
MLTDTPYSWYTATLSSLSKPRIRESDKHMREEEETWISEEMVCSQYLGNI